MLRSSESPLQGESVKSSDTSRMKGVPQGMEGRQRRTPLALDAKKASGSEPGSGARERGGDPRMSRSSKFDFGSVYALAEDSPEAFAARGAQQKADQSWQRYRAPGRGKFCIDCGSPMKRTSRMILSPLAGLLLLAFGGALMTGYGMATNFYQTPWFLKFVLPAIYYIGSIFVGVGLLFFFIREKVWKCRGCKEIRKR
jgi:hypothetical protein